MIRLMDKKDMEAVMGIYDYARLFMLENGNPRQWGDGYPTRDLIEEDLRQERIYVCEDELGIYGVFVFVIGIDETYLQIEGGWRSNEQYGVIHRIAGNGRAKGLFDKCLTYCESKISYMRIDTHEDNKIMQYLVKKHGFEYCGLICVRDGSTRLAFDRIQNTKNTTNSSLKLHK